jgi:hypothetical protein
VNNPVSTEERERLSHGNADARESGTTGTTGGRVGGRENYFYARNDPNVYAGAVQLIRLVSEVAHKE